MGKLIEILPMILRVFSRVFAGRGPSRDLLSRTPFPLDTAPRPASVFLGARP